MEITKEQASVINVSLQINADGSQRTFALGDLVKASEIMKEIMKNTVEDHFIDGEIELTAEQKVFIS